MGTDSTIADVLANRAAWCVVCDDNREILRGMHDGAVTHVISDPPFTQATSDGARAANTGTTGSHSFITFNGVDGQEGEIMGLSLFVASRWVVLFAALEQLGDYRRAAGSEWIRGTAWHRTNPAPQFTGDRPGQRYEGIAIAHRTGRKRWNRGGECWAPSGPTINSTGEHDRPNHPTPKPLWLMLDCLDAFTDPGELILDPFAGSGTTGVAAVRLGRRCILIERDAKYAAIARERMEAEGKGLSLAAARAGQLGLFAEPEKPKRTRKLKIIDVTEPA